VQTGGGLREKLLAVAGFPPAPTYVEKTAMQNRIAKLYREFVSPEEKTTEEAEMGEAKMKARNAILLARQNNDAPALKAAIDEARKAGISPTYINHIGKTPSDQYMFSRLPNQKQRDLLQGASDEDFGRYYPRAHGDVKKEKDLQTRWSEVQKGATRPHYTPGVFDKGGQYAPPP
jgi:hypothetical protein